MPIYDYLCASCGPFSAVRQLADYAAPAPCDRCGAAAPRGVSAPSLADMDGIRRDAHARSERARHEPRRSSHPPGCGCCKSGAGAGRPTSPAGAKSFPGARPWMISH